MADDKLRPTRLDEVYFSEGNLIEHPIFRISNKEAKPFHDADKELVNLADYVIEHILDTTGAARRKLVVRADPHRGFPTIFAYRVLLAVLKHARVPAPNGSGRDWDWLQKVPITRKAIRQALKLKHGGSAYDYIDEALSAMKGLTLEFYETWWDAPTKSHPGRREESLLKHFQFRCEGRRKKKDSERQQELAIKDEYVELGDGLLASCRAGYFIGVDMDYLNDLRTDLARRLYSYLTKRDGKRASKQAAPALPPPSDSEASASPAPSSTPAVEPTLTYKESLEKLARKLPLARTKPSYVRAKIEPALKVFCAPLAPTGRQFLAKYDFVDDCLVVEFFRDPPAKAIRPSCREAMEASKRGGQPLPLSG